MKKKNIDDLAREMGFEVKRVCDCNAYYYLMDSEREGWYKYNSKGEKICVEIGLSANPNPTSKKTLPYVWFEKGYTNRVLKNWWSVQTYVTNKDGKCYCAYSPTIKRNEDGRRFEVNFDWMLEATNENFKKIMEEILRRFLNKDDVQAG